MSTSNRAFRVSVFALVFLFAIAFVVCVSSDVYAKGPQRTQGDDSSTSSSESRKDNTSEAKRSDERPSADSSQQSKPPPPSQESRYTPAPPPQQPRPQDPTPPPPSADQRNQYQPEVIPPQPRKGQDQAPPAAPPPPTSNYRGKPENDSRADNRPDETRHKTTPRQDSQQNQAPPPPKYPDNNRANTQPDRSKNGYTPRPDPGQNTTPPPSVNRSSDRTQSPSPERLKGNPALQPSRSSSPVSPIVTPDKRLTSPDKVQSPNFAGVYRKEFADLSQVWKERRERRDTRSDSWRTDYRRDHDTNVYVNVNIFPGSRYGYYAYDYDPWYSYPSVYCYYHGLFPPFISYNRVVYIHRPVVVYRYVDLPMTIIYREYIPRGDDDYYLSSYRYRYLSPVLRDIERAWERSDADILLDHIRRDAKIDVLIKDEYAYTIDRRDFVEMTEDAMTHIRTVDFDFYRVRQRDYRTVVAYATHTYYDDDFYGVDDRDARRSAKQSTVYLRYTLERSGNDWYITEVGTSPTRAY